MKKTRNHAKNPPEQHVNNCFGVDVLAGKYSHLKNKRIGLLTNDAARPSRHPDLPSRKYLLDTGFRVKRLFSPEHGIAAEAEDGVAIANITDPVTGLPVVSLYGNKLFPGPDDLQGLDLVMFDIPDAGARFYTYNWSMSYMLGVCASNGIPFYILDRPNPLGGTIFEGPMQDEADNTNFLGRANIPVRHGLSTGELALLLNREWNLDAQLTVIQAEGWGREMLHQTGFPFHRPSPALQTYEAVVLYPGLCLFEAVNISIGRGTEASFLQIGAPWLDPEAVIASLPAVPAAGLEMMPVRFVPGFRPWERQACRGIRFRVTDPESVQPVSFAISLMAAISGIHRADFRWTTYPTAANPAGVDHFIRLSGSPALKHALDTGPETVLNNTLKFTGTPGWQQRIGDILIYNQRSG